MPLPEKLQLYHPGWYLTWNGIGPPEQAALSHYRVEQVAVYLAFDDSERDRLILFRITAPRPESPSSPTAAR